MGKSRTVFYFAGILCGLFAWNANAASTLISISGASEYQISAENGHYVYGGIAIPTGGACTGNGTDTCDSCTGTAVEVCNHKSIYPSLMVRISAQTSDTSLFNSNTVDVVLKSGDNSTITATAGSVRPDGTGHFIFETSWGNICAVLSGGNANCAFTGGGVEATLTLGLNKNGTLVSAENITIKFVVSSVDTTSNFQVRCDPTNNNPLGANEGFCFMQAYPGDGKMYIDGPKGEDLLHAPTGFPAAGGAASNKWKKIVVFHGESAVGALTNGSDYTEIEFDNTGTSPTVDARVKGLTNGTKYCLIMANQDVTGNISRFTNLTEYSGGELDSVFCSTPSTVVGLLDDKKCFIATAAWGSPLDPHVATLRHFRDQFLKTNKMGRGFVEAYYRLSPPLADFISRHDSLRASVRMALWPLVALAHVALSYGVVALFVFLSFIILSMTGAVALVRRRPWERL